MKQDLKSVELTVERIVAGGNGLAQLDGLKVFVPLAAPQERLRCRFILRKKDYAVAKIEEIIEPSPLRVQPACPLYGQCGGCQLQHLSYEGQLIVKKSIVNDALQRLGAIFLPVRSISPPTFPWHYRNKTQYPVQPRTANSRNNPAESVGLRIGFFRRESHDLVDVPSCLLHPERFDQLRIAALDAFAAAAETGYDEKHHRGNIRHFILRSSTPTAEQMLVIVVTRTKSLSPLVVERLAAQTGITGVVQVINPSRTNRILGDKLIAHTGTPFLIHKVLDKSFRVSASSFFQVNSLQVENLCRKVLKHAAPEGNETVLDLYSGVGMLSLVLAKFTEQVTGVEIEGSAVEDARYNAELNGVRNVRFLAGNVDDVITTIERADLVVLDPPRKGCNPETITRIAALKPKRIVYVSCNPATLARDLALFEKLNYEVADVEPLDMFPQTCHIEAIARLERKIR